MFHVSRGFVVALGGVGMTLLAWFGAWAWPGWPASAAIDLFERSSVSFPDLPRTEQGAFVVLLIIINVGVWAGVIRVAMLLLPRRGHH
jgi:hypothetical protein